jgi:hypothetical protein
MPPTIQLPLHRGHRQRRGTTLRQLSWLVLPGWWCRWRGRVRSARQHRDELIRQADITAVATRPTRVSVRCTEISQAGRLDAETHDLRSADWARNCGLARRAPFIVLRWGQTDYGLGALMAAGAITRTPQLKSRDYPGPFTGVVRADYGMVLLPVLLSGKPIIPGWAGTSAERR